MKYVAVIASILNIAYQLETPGLRHLGNMQQGHVPQPLMRRIAAKVRCPSLTAIQSPSKRWLANLAGLAMCPTFVKLRI